MSQLLFVWLSGVVWGARGTPLRSGPSQRLLRPRRAGTCIRRALTDNDITGGNSGSPVLNARGKLIGLAFDDNKESLATNASYTPGYNKCVCVDIRYVLWILRDYVGLERVLTELE